MRPLTCLILTSPVFALTLAFLPGGRALGPAAAAAVPAPPVFLTEEQTARCRRLVPAGVFTEAELARAVFYDRASAPPAYQDYSHRGGLLGWFDPRHNVSANQTEKHGNANREFPWLTGGLDDSTDGWDFKLYIPPAEGARIKGSWETLAHVSSQRLYGDYGYLTVADHFPSMVARYPVGAKVGEVLLVQDPNGNSVTFEVRVMEKVRIGDLWDVKENWAFKVYRAVRDHRHLLELVGEPGTHDHYVASLKAHYAGAFTPETLRNTHPVTVFASTALVDELPSAPPGLPAFVHGRAFREVTDRPWLETASHKAFAGRGGVFPSRYQGNHFNSQNCFTCHATVAKHADDFDLRRDWYGRVRGSDGVFSLPLADPTTVTRVDTRSRPTPWHRKLVAAGLLEGGGR